MHGGHVGAAVAAVLAGRGGAAELAVQSVEDPEVVARQGGVDVDVHLLEDGQRRLDVVREGEWQGPLGRRARVRREVDGVRLGRQEVAADVLDLADLQRVAVLVGGHGQEPREQEEVQRLAGRPWGRGSLAMESTSLVADGWVVELLGLSEAEVVAEDRVVALGAADGAAAAAAAAVGGVVGVAAAAGAAASVLNGGSTVPQASQVDSLWRLWLLVESIR